MTDLAAIKRRISSRISEGQTRLALLDATVTGTKASDRETKLHRLVIRREEAIHAPSLGSIAASFSTVMNSPNSSARHRAGNARCSLPGSAQSVSHGKHEPHTRPV
jgi:hypothetical protein